MSRPNRVYPKSLPKFDKLHTKKVKMYCGTEITALHLIKETTKFFISIDSWAFCCSKFKQLKNKTELQLNIPIIENEATLKFLEDNAWNDWVDKELKSNDTDMIETIQLLDKLFPNKKKIYFYELHSIIGAFCHGTFVRYNDDGSIETPNIHDLEHRGYYNNKYLGMLNSGEIAFPSHINDLYDMFRKIPMGKENEEKKTQAYRNYRKESDKFLTENYDLTPTFINIGANFIICPYIFSDCCVKGSTYENAGDIYMVVTNDTVYFETERHF